MCLCRNIYKDNMRQIGLFIRVFVTCHLCYADTHGWLSYPCLTRIRYRHASDKATIHIRYASWLIAILFIWSPILRCKVPVRLEYNRDMPKLGFISGAMKQKKEKNNSFLPTDCSRLLSLFLLPFVSSFQPSLFHHLSPLYCQVTSCSLVVYFIFNPK